MELKLRYALLNKAFSKVLIVPYGIETRRKNKERDIAKVLIVPYGIETCSLFGDLNESYGVNCTLWN